MVSIISILLLKAQTPIEFQDGWDTAHVGCIAELALADRLTGDPVPSDVIYVEADVTTRLLCKSPTVKYSWLIAAIV